jgi:AcrR family transcriptional regulator
MARVENFEQSELRRHQILATALEVIAERGYLETRIADIAKRAGISNGLVMYYFPTKVELLIASDRWAEDLWHEEMQEALVDAATATDRLEGLIGIFIVGGPTPMLQMDWSLRLDLWSQATRDPQIDHVHRENDCRWRATLTSVIEDGIASKEFALIGSLDNTVIALAAMFDGFAVNVACHDGTVDATLAFTIAMRFASLSLGFVWENDEATATRVRRYFEPVTTTR